MNKVEFFLECIDSLTDSKSFLQVSEWAEQNRYLPTELTPMPGYWDNSVAPYLVEPMDCMSVSSPVRKVAVMKGAQICATTGLIENPLGYAIEEAPSGVMYVSADKGLTERTFETKIERLLDSSNLRQLISSQVNTARARSGDKATYKEFPGGFIYAVGAGNPGKLRAMSVKRAFLDEIDAMPDKLGHEGSPESLIEIRTRAFESSRKIMYLSTPVILQTSKIWKLWEYGDKRRYYVPCKYCGKMQYLVFRAKREDGKFYGFVFEIDDDGTYIYDSVRYLCKKCLKPWANYDKAYFLPLGEWRPEKKPLEHGFRSYHIPSFISPVGIYSWNAVITDWLKCYDEQLNRIIDVDERKVFRQTVEGLPWEERGEAPKFEKVISHRRAIYARNQIPNKAALQEAGSPIFFLLASADVHKERIDFNVIGWCRDGVSYNIDYRKLEGDTEDLEKGPWKKLREIIETEVWKADDGKKYKIQLNLIDARYRTDTVYSFCSEYSGGVFPIMGLYRMPKGARVNQFAEYKSKFGTVAYNINTTYFKDRLASWLRKDWNSGEMQPLGYPNFPVDYGDDYFHEFESEQKMEERSRKTGQVIGYYWKQIDAGHPNHAWDCFIYNMAALELVAYKYCTIDYKDFQTGQPLDGLYWPAFWKHAESGVYYTG